EIEEDKKKETFISRYIDLLAQGLHSKLEFSNSMRAEIAIYDYNIRRSYLSYSSSIRHISTAFAIRAARPLDKAFILVKPFDIMVWICIPLSFSIILITSYKIMNKENEYRNKEIPKFFTLFWIILRNFLRQDTTINRYFLMTFRILIGCWILIAFVLTSAYVGTLPSFMVNPGTETIPQTFQELAQSMKYYRENVDNSVIKIFTENVAIHYYFKYKTQFREPIEEVLDETHALLASRQKIELSMNKQQKEVIFISEDILFTKFLFIQINLIEVNYGEEISKTINRIQESGLSEKIDRDLVNEKRRNDFFDDKTIDTNNEPLKMDDIKGLLYLLLTGYLIASVVFITEILFNKIKKIRSRKCKVRPFNIVN
ncbi:glutamate receptor ionotropic, delta-1-like, partial [Centruroides vittatus]|uniref:glutamate receptor ionotropic, delta-1-like n=1 Tax=Centruroides vittatus TaxID=120091 RepID=UPI00350EA7B1